MWPLAAGPSASTVTQSSVPSVCNSEGKDQVGQVINIIILINSGWDAGA